MKILYDTYKDIGKFAKTALKDATYGVSRCLWVIILLIVNSARFGFLWVSKMITKKPDRTMIVFLILLLGSNAFNYFNMKAKVTTAEWKYDSLELHTDSVYELYNINKGYSYSRVVNYE